MFALNETNKTTRRRIVAFTVLVLGLALSLRLIFGGSIMSSTEPTAASVIADATTLASLDPDQRHSGGMMTKPIETLRVGDRVLAENPEISDQQRATWAEPEWQDWLHLSLKMPLTIDGTDAEPAILEIEILRPQQWFIDQVGFVLKPRGIDGAAAIENLMHGPKIVPEVRTVADSPLRESFRYVSAAGDELGGRSLDLVGLSVELDLPEMGAVGTAYVTEIKPCPGVRPGSGQVVTATFAHPPSVAVLDVTFQDASEPIGVTDNHPFWSVDRQQFIPIGQMEIGERVLTLHGETKRIESRLPRPGPQLVYNLEVYGEHVYYVGQQGLLVHNSYQSKADRLRNKSQVDLLRDDAFSTLKSVRRHVEKEMRRDPKLRGLLNSIKGGDTQASMIYGFILDARVKRTLQQPGAATGITRISGLVFSSGGSRMGSVVKPGGTFGVRGQYRLPDFTFTKGGVREFWDLKGPGFQRATSRQFDDIRNWTGIEPIALRYNR
ncbi:MAG: hypothetical protein KDB00_30150 [Planctomycetales bacterium]|nr:hypothetical protein [Planctomycetales bacterium]